MPTRPSLLGGPLSGEIDLRPPEQPEFGVGVLDMAALANPLTLVPVLGARAALDEDFRDVGAAAFRNENIVGSMLTMPRLSNAVDPEFDLMKRVEEEGELRSFDYFMTARNEDDFRLKLERLRKERDDRRVLAESGMAGAEMSLFAGILDLPTLIPGAAISRTAGRGLNAVNVGASAAGAAGAAETVLQSNQAERTAAESLFAVGGSFILGAGIGAGVGRAVPKPLFDTVAKQIENLPAELDNVGRSLSAAAVEDAGPVSGSAFDIRNEGIFRFMRKFPGGYLGDVAEKFGMPGLAVVLEKAAPLAPFTRMEVLARSQLQSDPVGRRITADLMESVWQYRINEDGGVISAGGSVEGRVKYRTHALLNENLWAIKKAYSSHVADGPVGVLGTLVAPLTGRYARLQGAEKLTAQEFMREVGIAMFSGDTHPVKAVRDLAAQLRGKVFEPLRKDMVDAGLFDDLPFKPKYGESYMTRRYRIDKIRQNERAVVARLVDEFQANQVAARQRLRDAEVKGEPVVGSDEYVANMTLDEIQDSVRKTLNSIKGLNLGDSFLSVMNSSPLHARVLDVPDHVLLDLGILETDIGVLTESYIKSVVPRIEMQRKFGNLTLEPQLKEMSESYSLRREGLSAPKAKQLESEELARRQDLIGARDRILGVYDMPANPDDIWSRATKQVRNLSYMQLLGMQVISAAPDVSGLIRRAGLREFAGGVLDMATKMPTFVKNSREAAELLNAIEVVGNTRARNLAELDARYMNLTPAERLIEGATGVFSHATGMTAWNMTWKSVANVMVMSRILKAADALVKGKATKAQKIALSENLIDEKLARRIVDQFEKHGEKGNGLWYARAGKWDDADAYNAGQMAMSRETDIAVITPGQDKPLFFSSRVGAFFMQFKSFGVSANHRIVLAGLQQHDASVLMQFAALFAMGAVVSNLRADLSGRPRKEGDALLIDAIDRAGPFQIAFEANAVAEIGGVGLAGLTGSELPSRFQGRSKILGALGPNVDMGAIFLQTLLAARSEKGLSPRDVDKVARLLPFQNTPYGMLFRNDIREGIAGMFGAEYEP